MTPPAFPYDVERWIVDLSTVLSDRRWEKLDDLLREDSSWRDTVALTWDYRQAVGRGQVTALLRSVVDETRPDVTGLSPGWPEPQEVGPAESPVLEFFVELETRFGRGTALVRAVPDSDSPYGFLGHKVHTRLDSLREHPMPAPFASTHGFSPTDGHENWLQSRAKRSEYLDRDPQVLIVGGGHSGLMAAAHLGRLGVDALIVDKNARVGDNWRGRYHSLTLHTPTHMSQMPYLAYPDNFPLYISKDKLANWFETYAESLDLSFWTSTEFLGGEFDEEDRRWSVRVRRADGTERALRPRHVVMATGGVGGLPQIPRLPGIDSFTGPAIHSTQFTRGEDYEGRDVIVVGVGTSAHDIALDLYENGARVTMLQRNPVAIVSLESATAAYADYVNGVPDRLVDFRTAADGVFPVFREALAGYQAAVAEWDRDLHHRLQEAGLRIEDPHDADHCWVMKFYRDGGGYYLNIGASDVIADGGITVVQSDDIDTFRPEGLLLGDGTVVAADAVVMATGFEDRQTEVAALFGHEVADRVGPIGRGFDEDGEWVNVWKPSPQRGLWFMLGGISHARTNSLQLALLITADIEGYVPDGFVKASRGRAATQETEVLV